jgi:hypothetical protein
LTWTVIIHNHRTERGDKPIQGNRNGELELWDTAILFLEEETALSYQKPETGGGFL